MVARLSEIRKTQVRFPTTYIAGLLENYRKPFRKLLEIKLSHRRETYRRLYIDVQGWTGNQTF